MYLHQTFIFLCGVYICGAGYGTYGYYGPTPQSDVEAPSYVPPYIRNNAHGFSYPHNYRTKNAYSGTKTAYSGTKTAYIPRKTGYAGTKTHYAPVNGYNENSWSQENVPNQRPFISGAQEMGPKCEIECKNNGICVDTNTCKCPPNFHGTYCEFEKKPCLVYPPLPMNSIRKCSTEYCTVTCMEGHKFIDGTTVANMRCVGGEWQPTRADFSSIPDCTPECDPPCLNGGVCLSVNTCQCSAEYRGPQCQYSASACDIRKLAFNGGYNCSGDGEQFSCTLSCPAGADFSTPPASLYTCLYSTGVFMPQPIPHCVFNQVIVITPSNRPISSTFYEVQNLRNITTSESVHLTPESAAFGAGSHKPPSHQVIVVQDFTPKGGACLTWAGVHYKTFDGKIYSFQSPCQHILVRDSQEHKYTVAVRNPECQRHDYCPSELVVYLDDKMYALSVGEDGAVLFRNTKRLIPIPASLPGIRVSMPSDQVFVNLDALGVTIKWDTNNIIVVEGTLLLWNKTEGLCGTLDGNPENDFRIKDGTVAKTKSMMVASWQVNKIGDICDSRTAENSACASKSDEDMKKALQFCTKVFSKDKFRKCSKVMDVSLLLEACQWDYCACTTSLSPEECACKTVSVYAKECLRHGVEEMKTWRDSDTCPMQCPDGKIYRSCGTDTQPSCAFPLATKSDNSSCVEGCFCPDGLFLEGGRCIPKVECPCRVRNQSFPPGTVLKKSCNTCTCQAGEWICTQVPCGARCSAVGDPHYTTFDGLRYDFMGACTYTLLQTENVTVEVENVACSGSITEAMNLAPYKGDGKPSCTKAVNVLFHGAHIHMKQGGFILVNGKEVSSLPVNVGDIRIRAASSLFIIVQLPIKVDLWWDGNTRVFVDVPPEFHQSTKGLCGTFNLNQKDDFLTPEGDVEQSAFAFANKWKTREFCNDVAIKEPEHPCKANIENKEAAEKYCSVLKSALFESCHWYVDVQPYYENCLYDMCACDGDASRCLCPILGDYAMACAASGVYVQWRYNVKECEISCSGGQEYTVCADSCLRTCSDVALASKLSCKSSCVEGCACPPGQVLDSSNVCVPVALCPCFHKGMQFNPGYKEVRAGARERELCTCVGARWDCEPATPDEIARYPPAEDLRSNCSAANHREFTTCEVAEPLTCKNMHLARTATTSECRPGCQCKKGYVLDTGSGECILPTQCPCHHGGRSYADGESMQEECNTCECRSGVWECSGRPCVGVCAAWGDSHLSTFDGVHYDFEGVCSYLLAKGAMDDRDGFSVEIQNVPCGTTGATCSKSVTLKVSNADGTEESASLAQGAPLPDLSGLKRIKLRIAGAYVFLDVPSLAMSLQWDRELRVYIKLDSIWKNRVKGLCGNYNSDMRDDFQTPSGGGFAETFALIFADSWKLKPTCPKPQEVPDHCQQRPQRKQWAEGVCGALKRFPFTLCHSEVAVGAHVRACEADACACDAGDDCRCACAAIAHYAHACAARGVTFQWRSQELCPMQCDGECSNYNSCMSPCPPETCDNTLDYAQLKTVCEKETCVEGCKPKKACPEGAVYSNSTLTECVPRSKCRPVCMTLEDGKEVFEGEVIEEDDCHTCRCSKKTKVCTGQPCPTTATSPASPTSPRSQDEGLKCVGGWTPWLNRGPPEIGAEGASIENEPLPRSNELVIGSPMCKSDMMKKIECRTVGDHKTAKETGLDVECSLERGLVCREQESTCPDFEIRVFCDCEETFQCLDSTQPNHPHPTDCRKFYECTPEPGNLPGQKHAVVKECDAGLLYNPVAMVCDWPASVIALRPECGTTTTTGFQETTPLEITATQKPGEPRLMTSESSIGTIKSTAATTPLPTTSEQCPPGQVYSPCAYPCDNLCDHFLQTLLEKDQCMPGQKCVKACIDESVANVKCEFGSKWRDEKTCVPIKDCTCYDEGQIVKPGGVVVRGCEKCQCLDNALHCDTSDCVSIFTSAGPTHMSYIIKPQSTTPIVTTTIAPTKPVLVTISSTWTPAQTTTAVPQSSANTTVFSYTTQPTIELTTEQTSAATTLTTQPPLIIKSTTTPPPKCNPDNYKYLLWSDEPLPNSAFTASSVESALYEPQFAELNAHPLDISAGSWTPKTMDANQYIQVELPRREPIYGVIMQGSPLYDEYVTSYEVMYGDDGHVFSTVDGPDGNPKVFRGPVDNSNPVQQMIEPPIEAKFVRIRPLTWKEKIAVRFDVIGCEEPTTTTTPQPTTTAVTTPEQLQCTEPLGLGADLPLESIEVSSNNDARPFLKLDSERGWRPTYSTPREWIMFDFMSPRNITGIKTKGGANGWVTAYNVTYSSNLSLPFSPVVDSNGANQLFPANFDADTVVFSQFRPPIRARYLKLLPIKWSGNLEMRAEPVGCFEPYPTTIAPTPTSSPNASEPSCELCPGIPPSTCNCSAPTRYFDGTGCVSRDQCPCVEGFITYGVGSAFRGTNCDECMCKLGGITDCKPVKECNCEPDLVPKLSPDTCECTCEPCPEGSRLCPSSKLCLPLERWCDGLQDCGDDERLCSTSASPRPAVTEPTVVTTVVPTAAAAPPTTTAAPKPLECPKVECPHGYFVQYTSNSRPGHSRPSTSEFPQPRQRYSYQRYYRGGYSKGGFAKGGFSKTSYSKGGFSKGGSYGQAKPPQQNQVFLLDKPNLSQSATPSKEECAQFKCIPKLPPPPRPGSTPAPVICSAPACPPHYTLKLEAATDFNKCPLYVCVPPVERPVYCNVTGRTFTTFDGAEYKYDVCFHILARENRFNSWTVLVRKKCRPEGCVNQLMVHQDDQLILVKPNLMIEYDNYEYTVEQTSKICFQKNSFDVDRLGNGVSIKSRKYNFIVLYTTDGDVKIGAFKTHMGHVDGLCGAYDGDASNDRQLPSGRLATSIDQFGRAWAKPGLKPDTCQPKLIPPKEQKKCWDMCKVITEEPISQCGKVLNLNKWRTICLEKICECAEQVVNGTKRTDEECRCLLMEQLVAECLAADKNLDIQSWRMQMNCPAECPAPLVHYDCYRRRCEPTCASAGSTRRSCPPEDGVCFPGCYCPEGLLRKGDQCVAPLDCLDCACHGAGTPANYATFEEDDLPFLGKCTYLASRDRNETGIHKYQVYATNEPCSDNSSVVCTRTVHVIYEKDVIRITKEPVTNMIQTFVNGGPVFKYPKKTDWGEITKVNGKDVTVLLQDAHVVVTVGQGKMEFGVRVPSFLYANQTEGMCGVCMGYREQLLTSNGTATDDFELYGKSWQADVDTLTQLGESMLAQCGDLPPEPECVPPPQDHNPCLVLRDVQKFGACHALVDPDVHIELCEADLCAFNTTDACPSLERYADECRREGVCLDWRGDLCPYPCESPLVYRNCVDCERTCENNEELESNPNKCKKLPVEGCFCPEGKVRVNNTCIEPTKCFPCDANKEHYAGDEWQEDACTKCACSKLAGTNEAHVACTKQTCAAPVCGEDDHLVTEPPAPGKCCPTYMCVPKPQEKHCDEPKKMECGFGQVLKQKTTANNCKEFSCECKPASECEPIPPDSEVEIMEPGMQRLVDSSGCCPRAQMVCRPESCPTPPQCGNFETLNRRNDSARCCPSYECELPKDKCVVTLEWEAAPKGGEKLRSEPQTILKNVDEVWLDGPCRSCRCVGGGRGAAAQCGVTECPPLPVSEQFVLEPRPVPFSCCPQPVHVACRHGDSVYKVNETWSSPSNPCESYKCVRVDGSQLDMVTTVQDCDRECQPGWEYVPAEESSGQCCGKCKPVACVCEDKMHPIGETWTSADFCTNYTCVDLNGTLQVQSSNETCPKVSEKMQKQFVLTEEKIPGKCCPKVEPVACRVDDKIYQINETWKSATDACESYQCSQVEDKLEKVTTVQNCDTECQPGWEYVPSANKGEQCCGKCKPVACVGKGKLHPIGEVWTSTDFCTNYTCVDLNGTLQIQSSNETCPKPSEAMKKQFVLKEQKVEGKCCPVIEPVACRVGDNVYQVGENWTSPVDACESYECAPAEDGKLHRVTTLQACDDDCQPGWEYEPSANQSEQCCGKCKPVACVCEGKLHPIGEVWTSADFCTNYTCVDLNGTLQVQSSNETCPEVTKAMLKQFVYSEEKIAGKCCPKREPTACRVGNEIYQEGQSWRTADPCANVTCARDATGALAHKESAESCVRECPRGWHYAEPPPGRCCGRCDQHACLVDDALRAAGETWQSADNCTTYSCERDGNEFFTTSSRRPCPDVSDCAPENLVNETCCQVCKLQPSPLSTCVPTTVPAAETVGLVRLPTGPHGLCVNRLPITGFKECHGSCDSGTVYNNQTGAHDTKCECCAAAKYERVLVGLVCEDGTQRAHTVASPKRCACVGCGAHNRPASKTGYKGHRYSSPPPYERTIKDEDYNIPEMFARYGETTPRPRL